MQLINYDLHKAFERDQLERAAQDQLAKEAQAEREPGKRFRRFRRQRS